MLFCDRPHRGLAALVTACMLTVALPVGAAWAQKIKNPAPEVSQPAPAPAEVTTTQQVEIDTIEAVDSNLDEATLREIFSGNIADNAERWRRCPPPALPSRPSMSGSKPQAATTTPRKAQSYLMIWCSLMS